MLPPLRERPEDIPQLTAQFAAHAAKRFGIRPPRLAASELRRLQEYSWPGNVRELQNAVERAVIVSRGTVLRFDEIATREPAPRPRPSDEQERTEIITQLEWQRRERDNLRAALEAAQGRVYGPGGAAEMLGVKPTTLLSRLHALGLRRPSSRRARTSRRPKESNH